MKNCPIVFVAAALLFSVCQVGHAQKKADSRTPYFYAIGDMPYEPDEVEQYTALISRINATSPLFTIHVGDTKSGHVPCSDESYASTLATFNSFEQPLIYTPGDNEWTDCHTEQCGGFVAAERLDYLRKTIYHDPYHSLGKSKIALNNQSSEPGYQKFVENSAWKAHGVLFCTVHVCGSGNNYYSKAGREEFSEREKADLYWLDKVFERAARDNMKGVVICFHANFFWGKVGEGYLKIQESLERHSREFGKPVLLIYGDTHTYDVSKPLHNGGLLKNFTALQVFGSPDIYAVRVFIDDRSDDLFRFEPVYFD